MCERDSENKDGQDLTKSRMAVTYEPLVVWELERGQDFRRTGKPNRQSDSL